MIEKIDITQELTAKASENNNCTVVHLGYSCALSLWELENRDIYELPVLTFSITVVSLDRVTVLLSRVCNTAKYVYKPICQCAGRVVVAAAVQAWDIEPNIKIDVILLASPVSIFGVETRAGNDQKFILKTSDAMSMARIF